MTSEITPEPVPEIKPDASAEMPSQAVPQETLQTAQAVQPEGLPGALPEALPETMLPMPPRTRWQRFLHWEFLGLFLIVLVTMIFHFAQIERPATIVWDEVWYVGDARSIISGTGELRPEHPPLAKLFIVAGDYICSGFKTPEHRSGAMNTGIVNSSSSSTTFAVTNASKFTIGMAIRMDSEQMNVTRVDLAGNNITVDRGAGGTSATTHAELETIYIFTDTAFDWRFFSIIMGTLSIIIFYFICRKSGFSGNAATIATFLFALDDLVFVHSGLALLDVYMVTFMLAAVLFYLDERYILSGIFVALAANCKLVGVLIIIAFCLHWVIYRRDKWKAFAASLAVSAVSFVFFLEYFDLFISRTAENPVTRIKALLSGTAANIFTNPKLSISSRPWTWLYPQWFRAYYMGPNVPIIAYSFVPQQYLAFISPTIQILILPVIGYMIYKAIKKSKVAGFVLLWFLATYIVWIPLDIFTNRVTFVFYFLSTTPAICIGLGIAISDWLNYLKKRRAEMNRLTTGVALSYSAIGLYLFLHLAIFIIFNPAIPPLVKMWLPPFHIP
jgi:dolichyl-phosphate-mannose--protein O-mannosyl transferase